MQYGDFIGSILRGASKIAVQQQGKVSVSIKPGDANQVLTSTDLAIAKSLTEFIRGMFPKDNMLDEENGAVDKRSNLTWVIDPIDGTSDFAVGLPTYGIMVGLLDGGTPIAGGVALPAFGEVYTAEKGRGAFVNGRQIHVTSETNMRNMLVSYGIDGFPDRTNETKKETDLLSDIVVSCRNLRSSNSCFDQVAVATGKYGAWLNRTTKIWDNVATHIIIEEAGGLFTDFAGNPMDYTDPVHKTDKIYTVCAAPPLLHTKLQEIIHAHGYRD